MSWARCLLFLLVSYHCTEAAVVPFAVRLEWRDGAPDGYTRKMILVNGTSPGPTLYLNQGDTVEFLVQNDMPFPTTIHFHGIAQLKTPWSDGVPGLSQKPIYAGKRFLYKWIASDYGTYFYHGHEMSQISDGLFGPIHICPRSEEPTPWSYISAKATDIIAMTRAANNPHLITIADWDHLTSSQKLAASKATNYDLYCTNSILINGNGQVNCLPKGEYESLAAPSTIETLNGQKLTDQGCTPPTVSSEEGNFTHHLKELPPGVMFGCNATSIASKIFSVQSSDEWSSFNFISATALQNPIISIDDHQMWIYAADGRYIIPHLVDGMQIYNAQRYSAMIRLKSAPSQDAYSMRVANLGTNQIIFGEAILSYAHPAAETVFKTCINPLYTDAALPIDGSVKTLNASALIPFPALKPAPTADATHIVDIGRLGASWRWTMSGQQSYPMDAFSHEPLLYYPNSTHGFNHGLVIRTRNGSWIDIVLVADQSASSPSQPPHSFHKHSNKAFIIGSGTGTFPWATVEEAMREEPGSFDLSAPSYRDSFVTAPVDKRPTWLAIRYLSMNPGAFLMHCHIQAHLSGGMAMAILDGVDAFPPIPPEYGVDGNGT